MFTVITDSGVFRVNSKQNTAQVRQAFESSGYTVLGIERDRTEGDVRRPSPRK